MGLRIEVIEEKLQSAYKQKREAHSPLASLSRRLRIAHGVETSNSELHADMYMLTPYTPVMPIVRMHHRLTGIMRVA